MLYFDYAANTPVEQEVLDCFCIESITYIANPNSSHALGRQAKERMEELTKKIAASLGVNTSEIIFTSGASEANNLAIKGIAEAYKQGGKHIISTCLEHSSVSGALSYLQSRGYEIDLVDITEDGMVDMKHLKELLREDTILVTICYVDSELGVTQNISEIGELILNYPKCHFHSDATQAMGKIPVSLKNVDCITFAPHKFYGLNGSGILVKKEGVIIEPLIHGGTSTTMYRSGTPVVSMAAATDKALSLAMDQLKERLDRIEGLNSYLRNCLVPFQKVRINSTRYSVPHILNISVQGVKAVDFQKALEEKGVCVSIKSACSVANTPSRPVYAVTRDKKNALSSFRISLSHITTKEEIDQFMIVFSECYHELA